MSDFCYGVSFSAATQFRSVHKRIISCSSVLCKAVALSTVHEAFLLFERIWLFFLLHQVSAITSLIFLTSVTAVLKYTFIAHLHLNVLQPSALPLI